MPDSHGETRKEGSGYYDIESPLPYMRNLTTQLYFSSLNNNSVV